MHSAQGNTLGGCSPTKPDRLPTPLAQEMDEVAIACLKELPPKGTAGSSNTKRTSVLKTVARLSFSNGTWANLQAHGVFESIDLKAGLAAQALM